MKIVGIAETTNSEIIRSAKVHGGGGGGGQYLPDKIYSPYS